MTEFALVPENETYFTAAGALASGYQLFIYIAGSSTKATTHTESDGLTANANPIVLNALGQPGSGVYVASGTYKTILATDTDTDPPASAIRTRDNITPRNDTAASSGSEWVAGPTPTRTANTTFTLVGDQTTTFHVGRRLKLTDSGGTDYGVISVSAFTSLTTITVVFQGAEAMDSGLSAVSYGLLSADNHSIPIIDGSWTPIGALQTASTSATVDFTAGIDGTYPLYVVSFNNVLPATDNSHLYVRFSQATSFKSDSTYEYHHHLPLSSAATYNANAAQTAAFISLNDNQGNVATEGFSGLLFLPNPSHTADYQKAWWEGGYTTNISEGAGCLGTGAYWGSAAAIDGIRFLYNADEIASGTFRLYGVS